MFRRLPRRARKVLTVLGVLMVILGGIAAFTGCQSGNSEEKQGEDPELTGPEAGEARGTENSYPVLIVKTEYRDKPVVFQ